MFVTGREEMCWTVEREEKVQTFKMIPQEINCIELLQSQKTAIVM